MEAGSATLIRVIIRSQSFSNVTVYLPLDVSKGLNMAVGMNLTDGESPLVNPTNLSQSVSVNLLETVATILAF